MMNRRLVHLITRATIGDRPAYALHLIDPSTFFHSTKPSGADDGTTTMEEFRPPPPAITFHGPCTEPQDMDFMPVGRGGDKGILAVDCEGSAALYSASSLSLHTIPTLHAPKVQPIFFPVGDSRLYVMDRKPRRNPRHCFEALIRGRGSGPRCGMAWHWRSLPPPPYLCVRHYDFVDASESEDDDGGQAMADDGSNRVALEEGELGDIAGHTVIGDSQIWISMAGTYTFDTGSGAWAPRPLYWPLPFRGRAEYVPELDLWFGFSSQNNLLCASDLAAASATRPPVLRGEWEDVAQAEGWNPTASCLVPLGSCRLLVAKFFATREKQHSDNFAVLAGVELLRRDGGGLSMMKHGSKRYSHVSPAPNGVI